MNETSAKPPASESTGSTAGAAARSESMLRRAAIIALALIIIGAAAGLLPRWNRRALLRAETKELAVQTVTAIFPAPGKAGASLSLPAEVKPFLEAPIYARASGYLKRYCVDIGAQVKAGDLLAEIDTPELNQELAQARAQVGQAEAAITLARTTAARWSELLKTSSVSEQEAAEKQADLELKAANLEAARANLRRLEELQGFDSVRAPFAGTITARWTDVGQLVSATSGKELFRLAQTTSLRVYVRVPQSAARGVAPGQMAEVSIPEIAGRIFPAKIVRTSGAMSSDSRTLLTELELDNAQGEILAGTYAQARFRNMQANPSLTLPANTLLFRSEGSQVGVVLEGGQVELRKVTLGRDFGQSVEIIGGVTTNDWVILNPADSLVNGARVRVADLKHAAVPGSKAEN